MFSWEFYPQTNRAKIFSNEQKTLDRRLQNNIQMDEMNNQRALTLVGKKNYPTKKKLPKMKQNIMAHPCGVFESKFNSFVSVCV